MGCLNKWRRYLDKSNNYLWTTHVILSKSDRNIPVGTRLSLSLTFLLLLLCEILINEPGRRIHSEAVALWRETGPWETSRTSLTWRLQNHPKWYRWKWYPWKLLLEVHANYLPLGSMCFPHKIWLSRCWVMEKRHVGVEVEKTGEIEFRPQRRPSASIFPECLTMPWPVTMAHINCWRPKSSSNLGLPLLCSWHCESPSCVLLEI